MSVFQTERYGMNYPCAVTYQTPFPINTSFNLAITLLTAHVLTSLLTQDNYSSFLAILFILQFVL